ncbi:MAG: ACT domain-containing protein [Chloroflexi bacterium]|nr:ACT domain-containing protein [Chloroflexota bacterium]
MAAGDDMTQNSDQQSAQRRIIVITAAKPGALARVTTALAEKDINIEDIDGRNAGDLGVIRLRSDDDDAALRALLEADLRAISSDAVVFRLPDRPGALASVSQLFASHDINVRAIHIAQRIEGYGIVAVNTDNDQLARSLLDEDSLLS